MTKEDKKNAYLYCKFRDEQFALYDEYAKRHGMNLISIILFFRRKNPSVRRNASLFSYIHRMNSG